MLIDILGILAEENAQDDPGLVPVRASFFPSLTFLGVQVFIIYESIMFVFILPYLTKLVHNPHNFCKIIILFKFENGVDQKPSDQDPHCFLSTR